MAKVIEAEASPEKRLFISLLTRDIPLLAAFLDLIDNSINAAVEPYADRLKTAEDYERFLLDETIEPGVSIDLNIGPDKVEISDTAGGISADTAAKGVFKFGRSLNDGESSDRLSVYGIGLKRAIFKLGNKIAMRSDHKDGGFDMKLDVEEWSRSSELPWTFKLIPRAPELDEAKTGTLIRVGELHQDALRRMTDGVFEGQLRDAIARTYAFYLAKLVRISVNGVEVEGLNIELGSNRESKTENFGKVTCAISAGLGLPQAGSFRASVAGWYVFCNGRGVITADKTPLTGWGSGLPTFQPKHRPFLGIVFFVSENPEALPWTTTKAAIDEDSLLWQQAKRHMASIGRVVITFLDSRYSDEGTEIAPKELEEATGPERLGVVAAAVSQARAFTPPKAKVSDTVKIQFDAQVTDVKRIAKYLKRPGMSASDAGRHTFSYFLRNEVGES